MRRFPARLAIVTAFAVGLLRTPVPARAGSRPHDIIKEILVNGKVRRCLIHLSAGPRASGTLPLVIALHGHGGTAARMQKLTGLSAVADARGFIVAYPEGASWRNIPWRSWNAGSCCGYSRDTAIDDVAYLRQLLDALSADYPIDARRIYVTGVSNGGMMAYRAGCELADRIAAIAPVAGAMSAARCEPSAPVAVLIIHGTADRKVPYAGGRAPDGRTDPSVADAAAFWTRHNGAAADVSLHIIEGGRHAWPRDAAAAIWDFFSRQAKPAPKT